MILLAGTIVYCCSLQEQQGPKLPPATQSVPKQDEREVPPDPIDDAITAPSLPKRKPVKGTPVNRKIELSAKAQKLIRDLALVAIPDEFEDDKKWGRTKRVQSGLSVKFEDGKIRTHRKWKNVKHGRWQKHNIRMVEPEQRFRLQINNVVKTPEGAYHFDISCFARLRIEARFQDWRLGVPMLRISTDALTDVRLDAHCSLVLDFDYGTFPPAVELQPKVHAANVRVGRFQVKRISHLKGRVAEEFSGAIKSVVKREIAKRRKDLPKKINKKIAKKKDDLKISLGDWLNFSKDDAKSAEKTTTKKKK